MYGTISEVAALVPRYLPTGVFTQTTRPTLNQVTAMMERLSAIVDVMLGNAGIETPVDPATAPIAVSALGEIVIAATVDLVNAANSAGRFFSDQALRGQNPLSVINRELAMWIEMNAAGLGTLPGVVVIETEVGRIGYRDSNNAGVPTFPLFQRDAFNPDFKDWDPLP